MPATLLNSQMMEVSICRKSDHLPCQISELPPLGYGLQVLILTSKKEDDLFMQSGSSDVLMYTLHKVVTQNNQNNQKASESKFIFLLAVSGLNKIKK